MFSGDVEDENWLQVGLKIRGELIIEDFHTGDCFGIIMI